MTSASFTHIDKGTAESVWVGEGRWNNVTELTDSMWRGIRKLIVVVAHPDDETLGAAGLIMTATRLNIPVSVIVATDGAHSHPNSTTYTPDMLAQLRASEVVDAVAHLSPEAKVTLVGGVDGRLAEDDSALVDVVDAECGYLGVGAIIACTWAKDRHPDHEAVSRVCRAASERSGAALLEFPIWLWHWGTGDDVPWNDALLLRMNDEEHALKLSALDIHRTQVLALSPLPGDEVLLHPSMLEHFTRKYELFFDPTGWSSHNVFERLYRHNDDPWHLRSADYEANKRHTFVDAIPTRDYRAGLQLGCSIGTLTRHVAPLCTSLTAIDQSATAIATVAQLLPDIDSRVMSFPQQWPDGAFDLVVMAEVGYFLTATELDATLQRITRALVPEGVVALCHWNGEVDGWELTGPIVHERARSTLQLPVCTDVDHGSFSVLVMGGDG